MPAREVRTMIADIRLNVLCQPKQTGPCHINGLQHQSSYDDGHQIVVPVACQTHQCSSLCIATILDTSLKTYWHAMQAVASDFHAYSLKWQTFEKCCQSPHPSQKACATPLSDVGHD